jgi:hypothetical protein
MSPLGRHRRRSLRLLPIGEAQGMGRINPQDLHLGREEGEVRQGGADIGIVWMAVDIGVELGCDELAFELVTLELGHVHRIGSEAAQRLDGRVGGGMRDEAELRQGSAALNERVRMAVSHFHGFDRRALHRHQLMLKGQEELADDVQALDRHQMMDVGDAAGDRVFDRDHREIRRAFVHSGERILEGGLVDGFPVWEHFGAGDVRIS